MINGVPSPINRCVRFSSESSAWWGRGRADGEGAANPLDSIITIGDIYGVLVRRADHSPATEHAGGHQQA